MCIDFRSVYFPTVFCFSIMFDMLGKMFMFITIFDIVYKGFILSQVLRSQKLKLGKGYL